MIKIFILLTLIFTIFVGGIAYFLVEEGKIYYANLPNETENVLFNNNPSKLKLNLQSQTPNLKFVSATEYTKGDGNGSTIIKLVDWRGEKINTTCWETILYPNKTTYINWTTMTQHWEYGNYYMNFEVPEPLGIYDQEVRCEIGSKNISIGKGFHVGNISNIVSNNADNLKVDRMTVMS